MVIFVITLAPVIGSNVPESKTLRFVFKLFRLFNYHVLKSEANN